MASSAPSANYVHLPDENALGKENTVVTAGAAHSPARGENIVHVGSENTYDSGQIVCSESIAGSENIGAGSECNQTGDYSASGVDIARLHCCVCACKSDVVARDCGHSVCMRCHVSRVHACGSTSQQDQSLVGSLTSSDNIGMDQLQRLSVGSTAIASSPLLDGRSHGQDRGEGADKILTNTNSGSHQLKVETDWSSGSGAGMTSSSDTSGSAPDIGWSGLLTAASLHDLPLTNGTDSARLVHMRQTSASDEHLSEALRTLSVMAMSRNGHGGSQALYGGLEGPLCCTCASNQAAVARCQICAEKLCDSCSVKHAEKPGHVVLPLASKNLTSVHLNGSSSSYVTNSTLSLFNSSNAHSQHRPVSINSSDYASRPSSSLGHDVTNLLQQRFLHSTLEQSSRFTPRTIPLTVASPNPFQTSELLLNKNAVSELLSNLPLLSSSLFPGSQDTDAFTHLLSGVRDYASRNVSPLTGNVVSSTGLPLRHPPGLGTAGSSPLEVIPQLHQGFSSLPGITSPLLGNSSAFPSSSSRSQDFDRKFSLFSPDISLASQQIEPADTLYTCKMHTAQKAAEYCTLCAEFLCELCLQRHSGHSGQLVDLSRTQSRSQAVAVKEALGETISLLNNSVQRIRSTQCEIELDCSRIKKTLEEEYSHLMSAVSVLFAEARKQINEIEKVKVGILEAQGVCNQLTVEHLTKRRLTLDAEMERSGNGAGSLVRTVVEEITELQKIVSLTPREDSKINIRLPQSSWINLLRSELYITTTAYPPYCYIRAGLRMGFSKDLPVPAACHFYVCVRGHASQPVPCSDEDLVTVVIMQPNGNTISPKVERCALSMYRVSYYLKDTGLYTASVKLRGQHIHRSPFSFHFPKPCVVGCVGQGLLSKPWGVCINDENTQIIIGDRNNHCVQILSQEGTLLNQIKGRPPEQATTPSLQLGQGHSASGQAAVQGFSRPTGVAIDLLNRLIITDKDNHRVQVYSMEGEFLTMFGKLGQRDTEFNYPWGVAINSSNCSFIADSRNSRVVSYSPQFRFLRKTNFKKRITPRAITCMPDDGLLVSDFEDHCVYLVNSDLTMRTVVSSSILLCPLNRPQCLAIDVDGLVYVVESKPKRFQVFTANDEAVCCVESDGVHGPMLEPSGICIGRDGRIFIADSQNHRILIFR